MGFFDWILGVPKTPDTPPIHDPELGVLSHVSPEVWEGVDAPFHGLTVETEFIGDGNGPLPELRELFLELKKRYPSLRSRIEQAFCDHIDETQEAPLVVSAVHLNLGPDGVPTISAIHYLDDSVSEHQYVAEIEDWQVSEVHC